MTSHGNSIHIDINSSKDGDGMIPMHVVGPSGDSGGSGGEMEMGMALEGEVSGGDGQQSRGVELHPELEPLPESDTESEPETEREPEGKMALSNSGTQFEGEVGREAAAGEKLGEVALGTGTGLEALAKEAGEASGDAGGEGSERPEHDGDEEDDREGEGEDEDEEEQPKRAKASRLQLGVIDTSKRLSDDDLVFRAAAPSSPQPSEADVEAEAEAEAPCSNNECQGTDYYSTLGGTCNFASMQKKARTRPLIPKSSYYFGPPPPDSAFGTPPTGQIGIHHPREIVRIERDYSGGELIQFAPTYPLEFEGRITPTQFVETINTINEILISAHSIRHSIVYNTLAVFTLQISRAIVSSHYEKEMKRLQRAIDDINTSVYNPAGLHILWPRKVAFLFLEIEYY